MGPEGKWIEVQIRSRKMDEIAELGYAAHWKYKTGVHEDETELDTWMNTIKDILANPGAERHRLSRHYKTEPFRVRDICVHPEGRPYNSPSGATVLDMAFAIHSEVGTHCMAGKINHRLVPLSHRLDSGDRWKSLPRHRKSLRRNGCSSATPLKPRTVCGLF